ncbi:MAG: hypothetical protein H7099_05920 [Gemmatimonadaceae bacterium]|nr:hypothetical protein [Gemmatimonadaceae bacterium]
MSPTRREMTVRGARRDARPIAVVLVALVMLSGCLTKKPEGESLSPVAMTYTVPLTIESRFREDVTVFVVHDGIASRLTRAGSVTTTRFVIPKHMIGSLGEITLLLEPMGSRSGMADRVQSPRVRVLPGQGLIWTLETNLARSFLQVVPSGLAEADTVK